MTDIEHVPGPGDICLSPKMLRAAAACEEIYNDLEDLEMDMSRINHRFQNAIKTLREEISATSSLTNELRRRGIV